MFFKKKTTPQILELISCIVLEKTDKVATSYCVTLENPSIRYRNHYLWNYILRDVIVSVLTDYMVYIYTPDKENALNLKDDFEKIYPCYLGKFVIMVIMDINVIKKEGQDKKTLFFNKH